MRQRTYSAAQQAVLDDLQAGRILWAPIFAHSNGEIRESDGTYVREVPVSTLRALYDDGLIVGHGTVRKRYVLGPEATGRVPGGEG